MQFVLTGVTHDLGFRVFAFERIGDDRVRTRFTVKADLNLTRRYGIRLQELPLMCLGILERRNDEEASRAVTFTEEAMCVYAKDSAAARDAAAQKRKAPRRPSSENTGAAWRVPPPS